MFSQRFQELQEALASSVYTNCGKVLSESEALSLIFRMISETAKRRGVVYVVGNGGSAGIASHFSNDLMKALKIPSQTLYDSNLITCLSNDLGYENVFSYPLERLMKSEDLLVAISSSGASHNILQAVKAARQRDASVFTLSGFQATNPLRAMGELNIWVDRCDYGLVESAHFVLLHTIVDSWKNISLLAGKYVGTLSGILSKQN